MASDVYPQSDQALLEAQAASGPQGVEAYKIAKERLRSDQGRSSAIAQAAAQARGGPAGAMEQALNPATEITRDRIASLEAAQARASGQMSARDQRMKAYNDAVQGARSLIGSQAELAVAPIRAQADFAIRQQQQSGMNRMGEIDRQMALETAQFEAEARAREQEARLEQERYERQLAASRARSGGGRGGGGGGGGGGRRPNQGELDALLQAAGTGVMNQAQSSLADQIPAFNEYIGANVQAARAQRELDELRDGVPDRPVEPVFTGGSPMAFERALEGWQEDAAEWDKKWGFGDFDFENQSLATHRQNVLEQERRVREQFLQESMQPFTATDPFITPGTPQSERDDLIAFALRQEALQDDPYRSLYAMFGQDGAANQRVMNQDDLLVQMGFNLPNAPALSTVDQYDAFNSNDWNPYSTAGGFERDGGEFVLDDAGRRIPGWVQEVGAGRPDLVGAISAQQANWGANQRPGLQEAALAEALRLAQPALYNSGYDIDTAAMTRAMGEMDNMTFHDFAPQAGDPTGTGNVFQNMLYNTQTGVRDTLGEYGDILDARANDEYTNRQQYQAEYDRGIREQDRADREAEEEYNNRVEGTEEDSRVLWANNYGITIDPLDGPVDTYTDAVTLANKPVLTHGASQPEPMMAVVQTIAQDMLAQDPETKEFMTTQQIRELLRGRGIMPEATDTDTQVMYDWIMQMVKASGRSDD